MRFLLAASTATIALLAANAVLAQGADTDVDGLVVTSERATTATKTDTPLIRTPQSISVVEAAQIADRGQLNLQETLRYSAGAAGETYGLDTRGDGPGLRGFSASQYLDGLNRPLGFNVAPRTEVYTLERVEILRGPSSTLYGQGSPGGVINAMSKKPTFETKGEVVGQFGSFDRYQGMLDYQSAMAADGALAGRIVMVVRDSGMQTDHLKDDRFVIQPSIAWKPTDATTITLMGLYQDDETASSQQFLPYASVLTGAFPKLPIDRFLGEPDYDRLDAKETAFTATVNHRVNDRVELNANLRYSDASVEFNEIYAYAYGNPANPFYADGQTIDRSAYAVDSDTQTFTADVNAVGRFSTGAVEHTLLGGLDVLSLQTTSYSGFGMVTPINAYNPVYGRPFVAPTLSKLPDVDQTQVGLYLQDQLRWNDLTVVAGLRRDRAERQTTGAAKQIDEATTYRIAALYELPYGVTPYVSYATSFRPETYQDPSGQTFDPQKGKQWEVGVKWSPFAGALVTLAGYDLKETNRLANDPNSVVNLVQTGGISGKGVEFEASWTRPRDLQVTLAASHGETIVDESQYAYEQGRQVSDTPRTLASAWAVKTLQLSNDVDFRFGGGVRYVGSTTSVGFAGDLRTPSYTLADALVALDAGKWSLTLNATNLFDKQYFVSCRTFGDCFSGLGRNVVGTIGYRF